MTSGRETVTVEYVVRDGSRPPEFESLVVARPVDGYAPIWTSQVGPRGIAETNVGLPITG